MGNKKKRKKKEEGEKSWVGLNWFKKKGKKIGDEGRKGKERKEKKEREEGGLGLALWGILVLGLVLGFGFGEEGFEWV